MMETFQRSKLLLMQYMVFKCISVFLVKFWNYERWKEIEVNRNIYDLIAQRIRSRWTIMTSKDSTDLLFRASLQFASAAFQNSLFNALIQQSSSLSLMLQRSNYILKISHMLKTSVWFSNQISLSLINAFSLFLKHVALIVVSLWPCQMIQLGKQCCVF